MTPWPNAAASALRDRLHGLLLDFRNNQTRSCGALSSLDWALCVRTGLAVPSWPVIAWVTKKGTSAQQPPTHNTISTPAAPSKTRTRSCDKANAVYGQIYRRLQ